MTRETEIQPKETAPDVIERSEPAQDASESQAVDLPSEPADPPLAVAMAPVPAPADPSKPHVCTKCGKGHKLPMHLARHLKGPCGEPQAIPADPLPRGVLDTPESRAAMQAQAAAVANLQDGQVQAAVQRLAQAGDSPAAAVAAVKALASLKPSKCGQLACTLLGMRPLTPEECADLDRVFSHWTIPKWLETPLVLLAIFGPRLAELQWVRDLVVPWFRGMLGLDKPKSPAQLRAVPQPAPAPVPAPVAPQAVAAPDHRNPPPPPQNGGPPWMAR